MIDLNKSKPAALKAAMTGGTAAWGQVASAVEHVRYSEPIGKTKNWRKCHCGCGKRQTHRGMANGIMLMGGCEFHVMRWVRQGVAIYASPPHPRHRKG